MMPSRKKGLSMSRAERYVNRKSSRLGNKNEVGPMPEDNGNTKQDLKIFAFVEENF